MSRIVVVDKVFTIYDEINSMFSLVCRDNINPFDLRAFDEFCWDLISKIKFEPIRKEYIGKYRDKLLELNNRYIDKDGVIARGKKKKKLIPTKKNKLTNEFY